MRKIEQEMIVAVEDNSNWSRSNTCVLSEDREYPGFILLYGNKIMEFEIDPLTGKYTIMFNFCGWQTNTTKSRINAILSHFGLGYVFQKNYNLYYVNSSGKELQISNSEWIVAE
jgi:hypothetical protein